MTANKLWPIAAIAIVVLFYLWGGEDEPVPEQSARKADQPVSSSSSTNWQPDTQQAPVVGRYGGHPQPPAPYGGYSLGYTNPNAYNPSQSTNPGSYRFRQGNSGRMNENRIDPPYPYTQYGQDYSTMSRTQQFQGYQGYDMVQQPDNRFRFRPLDKKQQSKRWTGNYSPLNIPPAQTPSHYPYDQYPAPAYTPQSPSEPNPLWANSWPDR